MKSKKAENHAINDGDISVLGERQDFRLGDITWIRDEDSNWWPAQIVDEKTVCRDNKPKRKMACETLVRLYGTYDYLYIDLLKCRIEFEKVFNKNIVSAREKFQDALEIISESFNHKPQMNSSRSEIDAINKTTSESPKQDYLRKQKGANATAVEFQHKTRQQNMDGPQKTGQRRVSAEQHRGASKQSVNQNAIDISKSPRLKATGKQEKACKQQRNKKTMTQKSHVTYCISADLDIEGRTKKQDFHAGSENPRLAKTPASTRRTRMMQSLGLIAPAGSPFLKNGLRRYPET